MVADTFGRRFRGLLGRDSIESDEGLYFPGTSSLHMLGMRFPIAACWLSPVDASGARVVLGLELLRPWRSFGFAPSGAEGVIEAHPELLTRLRVGAQVRIG